MEVVDSAGSFPLTLSILMERRRGVLPCGEGEIGVGRAEEGGACSEGGVGEVDGWRTGGVISV